MFINIYIFLLKWSVRVFFSINLLEMCQIQLGMLFQWKGNICIHIQCKNGDSGYFYDKFTIAISSWSKYTISNDLTHHNNS